MSPGLTGNVSPFLQDVADYKSKGKFDGAKGPAKVARKKGKKVEEDDEDEEEEEDE